MKKRKYLVDIYRTYATCVEVEAVDESEAEDKAYDMIAEGEIDPASFEPTDEIETSTSGVVNSKGERIYN